MVTAIEEGNLGKVESILQEKPTLANSQHDWKLRFEFDDGAIIHIKHDNAPLLYPAVWYNNKDMVKLLLENGADVDSGYGDGTTLYHILCDMISYTKRGT